MGLESAIPGGKSHEYIEFVNMGDSALCIDSLLLTDGVSDTRLLSMNTSVSQINPGQVALILDPDYFLSPTQSHFMLPSSAVLLRVDASSICGGLTEEDGFALLFGQNKRHLASFADDEYDSLNPKKLIFTNGVGKDTDSTVMALQNIGDSFYVESVLSPGFFNCLDDNYLVQYDLSSVIDDSLKFSISIRSFSDLELRFSLSCETKELDYRSIAPYEAFEETINFRVNEGEYILSVMSSNNSYVDTLNIASHFNADGDVSISEVHPRNSIEWVELYNKGSRNVDLSGWSILIGESETLIEEGEIKAGGYALISSDNSFLSDEYIVVNSRLTMSNYDDTVKLISPQGLCDSLVWDSDSFDIWDMESLNRTAAEGGAILCKASPNSESSCKGGSNQQSLQVWPKVFSPNGDLKDDSLYMSIGDNYGVQYDLSIFSLAGERLFAKEFFEPDTITWDGIDSHGHRSSRGPVIIILDVNGRAVRSEAVLWR